VARGEVIRAEKGALRKEPYLMERPGGRLRHAGKKGDKRRNAAAALLDPSPCGDRAAAPGWGTRPRPARAGWVGSQPERGLCGVVCGKREFAPSGKEDGSSFTAG